MNKQQAQVKEFHKAFNLPAPSEPMLSVKDIGFRMKLVTEELAEVYEALYALAHGDPVPMIDLLVDLKYFIDGTAVAMGIDLEPFFDTVHHANMTKMHPCDSKECFSGYLYTPTPTDRLDKRCLACKGTGRVAKYREDGKVRKPEGWQAADLYELWKELYGER